MRAAWWWIDRWQKSTAFKDMTLAEQGAYRNLLDELWLREGLLPDDERILARLSGGPLEWPMVRTAVMAHFVRAEGGWRNETHDKIQRESRRLADKQARYRNKKGNVTGDVTGDVPRSPSPSPSPDQSPSPNTAPTEPEEKARKRAVPPDPIEILTEFGEIDFPEVRRALTEYVRGRAERKQRAQTPRGLRMGLRRLAAFGPSQAAQAILDATEGGWLKFYDPKPADEPRGPRPTTGRRETPGTQAVLNILARQGGVA